MTVPNSESSSTLRTTATMRKKAKVVYQCVIDLLKCIRLCKKRPDVKKNIKSNDKV